MEQIPSVALALLLALAIWRWVRRIPRGKGPLPDVPDAPSDAAPTEAPGMTLPYSSLDPTAPPKRVRKG